MNFIATLATRIIKLNTIMRSAELKKLKQYPNASVLERKSKTLSAYIADVPNKHNK